MVKAAFIGTALLLSNFAAAQCSKPFKLALEQWPPYVYTDATQQAAGLDIELIKMVFAEAGCHLVFVPELPKKRRLAEFMAGHIDVMLAASDVPERHAYSWFSQPYRNESVSLFSQSTQSAKYRDVTQFSQILQRKITLLSPSSGWYGEDYKKHYDALMQAQLISTFESFGQGMKMLSAKRAELIMGDTAAVVFEAKKQNIALIALSNVILSEPVHLMLSKKSVTEDDLNQINAALERLELRGTLKTIRTQYGLPAKVSTQK
ncbi:substrate-binding periplasmic protein [Chitinibacter sp. S2-10]|uniref:substrate-binding periplasmic protein n=1 Tax=Chitinibacter sp. S2-10 TaxID=3373597 RepID=UPI003977D090